jgi:amino-acid N-acetyltransferase
MIAYERREGCPEGPPENRPNPRESAVEIREATEADRRQAEGLLRAAGLPVPAPEDPPVELHVLAGERAIRACAGFERHGATALLRSIAVAAEARGAGHGTALVRAALARLDSAGIAETFLVTLDAAGFFGRLGFHAIARGDVPAPVRASPEWELHLCAGGTWMRRTRPD